MNVGHDGSTAIYTKQLYSSPVTDQCLQVGTKMAKVKLSSSDAQLFEVDEEVAFESQTIKSIVEDAGTEDAIPLPNVSGKILAKVIEFSKYHVEAKSSTEAAKPAKTEDEVKAWDADFVRVDQATLFDLILVRATLKPTLCPARRCFCIVTLRCLFCYRTAAATRITAGAA